MKGNNSKEILMQAQDVYNMLEDEQSKEIFIKRLQYNITNEIEHLQELVAASRIPDYENTIYRVVNKANTNEIYDIFSDEQTVVFYGAGVVGQTYYKHLNADKRENVLFCDRNYQMIKTCCGVPVIAPDTLFKEYPNAKVILGVVNGEFLSEICNMLLEHGFTEKNIFVVQAMKILDNDELENNRWGINTYNVSDYMYFDPIVQFTEEEIFVDVGVYDGSTSVQFAKKCKMRYKHIYLLEPDPISLERSKLNIERVQLPNATIENIGAWNENGEMQFYVAGSSSCILEEGTTISAGMEIVTVPVRTLDSLFLETPITYIKMDIEGAELNALKGASEVIKKYRPKLAISVYHKDEDIIDIPLYIQSLVPEYKFYMRHYTPLPYETVLYAIAD